jgi:hypothetical protein
VDFLKKIQNLEKKYDMDKINDFIKTFVWNCAIAAFPNHYTVDRSLLLNNLILSGQNLTPIFNLNSNRFPDPNIPKSTNFLAL